MKVILKRLLSSEKISRLKEKNHTYTFKVAKDANKKQIAAEIAKAFAVKVARVKTVSVKGKKLPPNRYRKISHKSDWKKAYVTLKEGQKIKEIE